MIKRVVINLGLIYVLIPLVDFVNTWHLFEYRGGVKYYPGDFSDYYSKTWFLMNVFLTTLYLVFLFVHNAIILHYREKDKELTLIKKIGVLWAIHLAFVLLIGSFNNIWGNPVWSNWVYLPMTFIPSVLFASAIHFLVDLPETKKLEKKLEIE